jgi:hypothetical protein
MTTLEAVNIFKILQDKYASPHLIDSEIVRMLNMAQYERLNRLLPDDMGGVVNFELDQNVALNIRPLIYYLNGLVTTTTGVILDSEINEKLVTALDDRGIEEPDATYFRIVNVVQDNLGTIEPPIRKTCKYVKQNNIYRLLANSFKSPGIIGQEYLYTLLSDGLQIIPIQDYNTPTLIRFGTTIVKHPRKMNLDPDPVDPEWDDYNMNLIIMIALQLAGISTRDEELIADIRNVKVTN